MNAMGKACYSQFLPRTWCRLLVVMVVLAALNYANGQPPRECYGELPPPELAIVGSYDGIGADGNPYTYYQLNVLNWEAYPAGLFEISTDFPCGANAAASRTVVDIFRPDGTRLYGYCGLAAPEELNDMSFPVPQGDRAGCVYITMTDQVVECDTLLTSNIACAYYGEGCTPGYWKNSPGCWECYDPEDDFSDTFGIPEQELRAGGSKKYSDPTLMEALRATGGDINALARHAVAALLNACDADIDYPMTEAEVIAAVQEAVAADGGAISELKDMLDVYNNYGCDQSSDNAANPCSPEGELPPQVACPCFTADDLNAVTWDIWCTGTGQLVEYLLRYDASSGTMPTYGTAWGTSDPPVCFTGTFYSPIDTEITEAESEACRALIAATAISQGTEVACRID